MKQYDKGQLRGTKICALLLMIAAVAAGLLQPKKWNSDALAENSVQIPDVPPIPKVIAGKPYSVTPGESPGTWMVKWGDQSMLWKAQPWMEDRQQKLGPAFIAQWTTPGLPMPFEVPIEQRDKIPVSELPDRCLTYSYYGPYYDNGFDVTPIIVHLPDGSIRTSSRTLEHYSTFTGGNGKQYLTSSDQNVQRKYMWEITAPEELRGEGGVTTVYNDPTLVPEDTLYLPTVRRTRRLAGAVAKQYFPGSIYRYEDISFSGALPQLDYKITGFKLFDPSDKLRGFNEQGIPPDVKRVSGAGDVVAIMEVTPKPGISWWYAKRIEYLGLMGMCTYYTEEYDANGKMIRQFTHLPMTGANPIVHVGSPDGPSNAPKWWVMWGVASVIDLEGGFVMDGWIEKGGFNAPTSPSIYSETTLAAQPMTLVEWLAH